MDIGELPRHIKELADDDLETARAERDAARAWAKAWKRAAKSYRPAAYVALASLDEALRADSETEDNLASALRVVEAAQELAHQSNRKGYIIVVRDYIYDDFRAAVREYEERQVKP